ncbi:MAG: hypothetical protein ACQ9ET_01180 [Nitrosomonadaceae bacterium]
MLAFLYLLAIFCVPLSHKCDIFGNDVHNYQLDCDDHQSHCDEHAGIGLVTAFYQYDSTETDKSPDQYCLACLHSLTSKTLKLCSNTSVHATQTVVRTQVLPQLSVVMQLEWLISSPLRAPPSMAS